MIYSTCITQLQVKSYYFKVKFSLDLKSQSEQYRSTASGNNKVSLVPYHVIWQNLTINNDESFGDKFGRYRLATSRWRQREQQIYRLRKVASENIVAGKSLATNLSPATGCDTNLLPATSRRENLSQAIDYVKFVRKSKYHMSMFTNPIQYYEYTNIRYSDIYSYVMCQLYKSEYNWKTR